MSDWRFDSRRDLESVLGLEFPADVTADWLARDDEALGLSYGYLLFAVTRPAGGGGG
jgi:hypothetical protein